MKNITFIAIFTVLITSCTDGGLENQPESPQLVDKEKDCETKKLRPAGATNVELVIEDISINNLDSMVRDLTKKISVNNVLSEAEDTRLIMILNTYSWRYYDNVDSIIDKYESFQKLEVSFREKYLGKMQCKYHAYIGKGMGIYFKELGILYTGSPGVNSRYKLIEN